MTPGLVYLPRGLLQDLAITTAEMVETIETLTRGREAGTVWNAPKAALLPGDGRLFMSMLAAAEEPPFMVVKSLGMNPKNAEQGLDIIGSLITLFNSRTGLPLAVMDGDWITAVRTAALSATAAKYLARPNSSVLAFIGCGVQAQSHLHALAEMFPLAEVRAFGRGTANRDALCRAAEDLGLTAIASASARDAVEGADLVVTSVPFGPDAVPFLDPAWLAPGAFAALPDHARPWLADRLADWDRIVIDDAEQEARMADPMLEAALIGGDLRDLVMGRIPPRQTPEERTAFDWNTALHDENHMGMPTMEQLSAHMEDQRVLHQRYIDRAKILLSPPQVEQFEKSLEQFLAMQEMSMKMAGEMFGGDASAEEE